MAGVTADGFERKTYETIRTEIEDELHDTIDAGLVLDASTPEGNIVNSFTSHLSAAWEVLEDAYASFDESNATGNSMVALAALTGTNRQAQTRGAVTATVNLDGGKTFAAGTLVAHEDGVEENRWYNLNEITTPVGAAANYDVSYVSEAFGSSATVGAGDLTVIAETVIGWNSITNALAATAGEDTESIEELRVRRREELQQAGSTTTGAIRADLSALSGMIDAECQENTTDATVGVIGPHGIRPIVWDGSPSAVADNDIAQAIHDARAAGCKSYGSESGNATAYDGTVVVEAFDRATEKVVEINVVIDSATGVLIADVRNTLLAAFAEMQIDQGGVIDSDVIYRRLDSAAFDLDGVDDVTTFQIRFNGDAWGAINLPVASDEAATLIAGNITVTGDVS